MSTYKYREPGSLYYKITWLQVIREPIWRIAEKLKNPRRDIPEDLLIGSITWVYGAFESTSVHIEGNRYTVNFEPTCFKVVKDPRVSIKPWRFKTKEEFIEENYWEYDSRKSEGGYPTYWATSGEMNRYLGQSIDSKYWSEITPDKKFSMDTYWTFEASNCTQLPLPIIKSSFKTKRLPRYRFLTKEEFKILGDWSEASSSPRHWNPVMNKYLGAPVPVEFEHFIDNMSPSWNSPDGWTFRFSEVKLISEGHSIPKIIDQAQYLEGWLEFNEYFKNPCKEILLTESEPSVEYPRKVKKRKTIVVESTTNITV